MDRLGPFDPFVSFSQKRVSRSPNLIANLETRFGDFAPLRPRQLAPPLGANSE
jgi:hypothetical protein